MPYRFFKNSTFTTLRALILIAYPFFSGLGTFYFHFPFILLTILDFVFLFFYIFTFGKYYNPRIVNIVDIFIAAILHLFVLTGLGVIVLLKIAVYMDSYTLL